MGIPEQSDFDELRRQPNDPAARPSNASPKSDLDAREAAERLLEMPRAMLTGAEEQVLVDFVVGLDTPSARVLEILQNHANDLM